MCTCPPEALDKRRVRTDVEGTKPVVITICNCDRRMCPTCKKYAWRLNGQRCPEGHPV